MNEEIKNVNTEEIDVIGNLEDAEAMEYYDDSECSGAGLLVLAVGTAIVGAGAALLHKNKAKIEDWRIKRWEKKGYIITKAEDVIPEIDADITIEFEEPVDIPVEEPVEKKAPKKSTKKKEE